MAEFEDALPAIMISGLQDKLRDINGIERDIDQLEKQISAPATQDFSVGGRIVSLPGESGGTASAETERL
ncbi:hypothetical protein [Paraburkholderia sp. BR14374]|uniref:hypothetical protein n=1 Tax=Paraburkholderia sp. BR14374 TaxID=3237007 RepID=UPI0034CD81A8